MSKLNQKIELKDGRMLGYDEHGAPDGKPLFYFHGSPSCRVESGLYVDEQFLQVQNIRVIAIDRPGMGLSNFQPQRLLLDWPKDVIALADQLGLERFSILAYSLGGPFGIACGFAIPERIHKLGIVSGAALFTNNNLIKNVNPKTLQFINMPRENPLAARFFLTIMLVIMPRLAPRRFIAGALSALPEADREVVQSDKTFQEGFSKMIREAMRQGTKGAYHESLLNITDWGFQLEGIQTPVMLWHGEQDKNIPVEMARSMCSTLQNCKGKFFPGEGHISLFKKHSSEFIHSLIE
ncbi:MAG: hypothetical protein A2029_05015 [Chloroflexi bacterium RBG_19FT_COMBO_47_9]|nr:MAG: hypothetical protein A2029_05015 [Chloroflexi bacterium RBG_19FT_COMBO_47_9]